MSTGIENKLAQKDGVPAPRTDLTPAPHFPEVLREAERTLSEAREKPLWKQILDGDVFERNEAARRASLHRRSSFPHEELVPLGESDVKEYPLANVRTGYRYYQGYHLELKDAVLVSPPEAKSGFCETRVPFMESLSARA